MIRLECVTVTHYRSLQDIHICISHKEAGWLSLLHERAAKKWKHRNNFLVSSRMYGIHNITGVSSDNIWSWVISFNWCDIYEWMNIEVKSVRSCHQMFYHFYLIHDSNDHIILQFIQLQNCNLACRTACQVKQLELNSFHTSLVSVNLNTGKRWQTFSCHKNIFIHSTTIRWSHPWLILWCQQCEATIILIKDVIQGSLQNQKAVFPCW